MGDYSDFCEAFGGRADDPDFMDEWLGKYALDHKIKHYKHNEKLKAFYDKQSFMFRETFCMFMDEDGKAAISHNVHKFIRVHHSKIERNPDFYIRIRYSLANNEIKNKLDALISENKLIEPKESYQKDHTLYIDNTDASIKEKDIIKTVEKLLSNILHTSTPLTQNIL